MCNIGTCGESSGWAPACQAPLCHFCTHIRWGEGHYVQKRHVSPFGQAARCAQSAHAPRLYVCAPSAPWLCGCSRRNRARILGRSVGSAFRNRVSQRCRSRPEMPGCITIGLSDTLGGVAAGSSASGRTRSAPTTQAAASRTAGRPCTCAINRLICSGAWSASSTATSERTPIPLSRARASLCLGSFPVGAAPDTVLPRGRYAGI